MTTPKTTLFRGYDSPALYRQDTLARIKQLAKEIQESIKRIKDLERILPRKSVDRS
jgi:hypothetical protein